MFVNDVPTLWKIPVLKKLNMGTKTHESRKRISTILLFAMKKCT